MKNSIEIELPKGYVLDKANIIFDKKTLQLISFIQLKNKTNGTEYNYFNHFVNRFFSCIIHATQTNKKRAKGNR